MAPHVLPATRLGRRGAVSNLSSLSMDSSACYALKYAEFITALSSIRARSGLILLIFTGNQLLNLVVMSKHGLKLPGEVLCPLEIGKSGHLFVTLIFNDIDCHLILRFNCVLIGADE